VQQSRGARLRRIAVDSLHAFVEQVQVGLVRCRFTCGNLGLHRSQLLVAVHDVVDCGAAAVRAFLCNVGDDGFGVQREFAVIRLQLAQEHGEQR